MIMIHNRYVYIVYIKVHSERQNDKLNNGHGKHHSQYRFITKYLPEFFLQYKWQNTHCRRILNFFKAMLSRKTVMPTNTNVSFHTYLKPSPFSMTALIIR